MKIHLEQCTSSVLKSTSRLVKLTPRLEQSEKCRDVTSSVACKNCLELCLFMVSMIYPAEKDNSNIRNIVTGSISRKARKKRY